MSADEHRLACLIVADPWRVDLLRVLREEAGEDFWIGAGFVRNPVWDGLFGVAGGALEDVDVVYYDEDDPDPEERERAIKQALSESRPQVPWQVRNQARMHLVHGHEPYGSLEAALATWPETATAVTVRLNASDGVEVVAPFGLADLLNGVLRPAKATREGQALMLERARRKGWFQRWPNLKVKIEGANCGQFGRVNDG